MARRDGERARPSVLLFLLCLAAGAGLYHEMRSDYWSRLPARAPMPAPAKVSLPEPLPEFELPPLVDFVATVERPLFLAERRPPEPEEQPVEQAEATPLEPLKVVVTGVILSSARSFALVHREGESEVLQLGASDTIDGWSVKEILADRVVFEREEESQAVELKDLAGQRRQPEAERKPGERPSPGPGRPERRRVAPRAEDQGKGAAPTSRRGRVRAN